MSTNPYTTPEGFPQQATREEALAKVSMPATLLLITGIISIFGALATGSIPLVMPGLMQQVADQAANDPEVGDEQREQFEQVIPLLASPINYVTGAIGLLGAIVMCIGAVRMKQLRSYGLSMAACIIAICPYLSACCTCIFPIAIGIWGIIVLANPDVKSHFS